MTIEETDFHGGYSASVLVGNWSEERVASAAEAATVTPGAPSSPLKSTFERTVGAGANLNKDKLSCTKLNGTSIDEQLLTTVAREDYSNPALRVTLKDDPTSNIGPRERRAMEALMREARELTTNDETLKETHRAKHLAHEATKTIQRTSYVPKDMSQVNVGTRVMKDPDGRAAVRDPVFIAETRMVLKGDADRWIKQEGTLQTTGALFSARLPDQEVAVTLYSEAVATGDYTTSKVNGGTLPISSAAPFNKSCNFTKPMSHYDKVVIDE